MAYYFSSMEKIPGEVIVRLNNLVKDDKVEEYLKTDPETLTTYVEFEGYKIEMLLTKI